MYLVKAIAIWLVMVIAAIANGLIREKLFNVYLSETLALVLSGVLLSILILLIIYMTIGFYKWKQGSSYIGLGIIWVSFTLLFEYGFGYFVRGSPISEINQIFNVSKGNLFILALIVTLVGPRVIAQYKGYIKAAP